MADVRGSATICDDRCGCPTPCPGGVACRCKSGGAEGVVVDHKECPCGEHCSCNPCNCPKATPAAGTGKAYCKCGDACTCATCAA